MMNTDCRRKYFAETFLFIDFEKTSHEEKVLVRLCLFEMSDSGNVLPMVLK